MNLVVGISNGAANNMKNWFNNINLDWNGGHGATHFSQWQISVPVFIFTDAGSDKSGF